MTNKNGILKTNIIYSVAVLALCVCASARAANVVPRGTSSSVAARPTVARRMPTLAAHLGTPSTTSTTTDTTTTDDQPTTTPDDPVSQTPEPVAIIDKTSQFDSALGTGATSSVDTSANDRAELIRAQRAVLDAADATNTVATATTTGRSGCDTDLRACMAEKCGSDFTKCSGDTDTLWGDKMDACRRKITTCTSAMYAKFAPEIRADRDMNARLASYNTIIDCGNRYNKCIVEQCGTTYSKCLGKSAGDTAISACASIARECTTADSGLASRTMNVFATLRQGAEVQVKSDEQRLYALRDQMSAMCRRLGAMFDERSLTCVYTVNFWAGENPKTPFASKKLYAGDTFDCTQNWFGIDVTTFKENAYRLTREQTSATSSLMGSGVGMAVGAITSGAINRAIDRHKADRALKQAQDDYDKDYGDKSNDSGDKDYGDDESGKKDEAPEDTEEKEQEIQTTNDKKPNGDNGQKTDEPVHTESGDSGGSEQASDQGSNNNKSDK